MPSNTLLRNSFQFGEFSLLKQQIFRFNITMNEMNELELSERNASTGQDLNNNWKGHSFVAEGRHHPLDRGAECLKHQDEMFPVVELVVVVVVNRVTGERRDADEGFLCCCVVMFVIIIIIE